MNLESSGGIIIANLENSDVNVNSNLDIISENESETWTFPPDKDEFSQTDNFCVIFQVLCGKLKEYSRSEIVGLAKSAGYTIIGYTTQNLRNPNPRYFVGRGKVDQLGALLHEHFFPNLNIRVNSLQEGNSSPDIMKIKDLSQILEDIDQGAYDSTDERYSGKDAPDDLEKTKTVKVGIDGEESEEGDISELGMSLPKFLTNPEHLTVIFNNRLGQNQILQLAKHFGVKVIDRDDLVLEIFENHARTRESKLQIELARMNLQTNIVKKEFGESVGEKQGRGFQGKGRAGWEPIMRAYRGRKHAVNVELNKIAKQRDLRRQGRKNFFNIGIVGYTNAGKSTLLNRLANASLDTADQEFTTVNPVSRKVIIPKFGDSGEWLGIETIFTDSVGFIEDMSPLLIEAFLSTMEELRFSDLILVVVDLSEPQYDRIEHKMKTSFEIMKKIGAIDVPCLILLNKCDKISPDLLGRRYSTFKTAHPNMNCMIFSGLEKTGVENLFSYIFSAHSRRFVSKKP